jgi:hypothetical protein
MMVQGQTEPGLPIAFSTAAGLCFTPLSAAAATDNDDFVALPLMQVSAARIFPPQSGDFADSVSPRAGGSSIHLGSRRAS